MSKTTMQYVDHGQGGDVSVLAMRERPIPDYGDFEVLIEVAYAGVNRPDVLQRTGYYPPPPSASPIMGLEVSGTVVGVGSKVTRWNVGDKVCALTHGGGYAEYVAVFAGHCLPIPKGMSMVEAAAIPENYFTVWTNLYERGQLQLGESLLIHGGSSGIGITTIQLARHSGAVIYTTVGNEEKMKACKKYGADHVINYKKQSFYDEVMRLTDGKGVNLIIDMVAGDYIQQNIDLLALEGRLVQIALLNSPKNELDIGAIMFKRLTYTGSTLRARTDADKENLAGAVEKHIYPLFEQRKCLPVIDTIFDFADVKKAHEMMEASIHIGKIMLKVND